MHSTAQASAACTVQHADRLARPPKGKPTLSAQQVSQRTVVLLVHDRACPHSAASWWAQGAASRPVSLGTAGMPGPTHNRITGRTWRPTVRVLTHHCFHLLTPYHLVTPYHGHTTAPGAAAISRDMRCCCPVRTRVRVLCIMTCVCVCVCVCVCHRMIYADGRPLDDPSLNPPGTDTRMLDMRTVIWLMRPTIENAQKAAAQIRSLRGRYVTHTHTHTHTHARSRVRMAYSAIKRRS